MKAFTDSKPLGRIGVSYTFAILTVAATSLLLILSSLRLDNSTVALVYLLSVVVNTTVWGLGPGVLSAITSFLAFNYFFIAPTHTFTVHQTQDLIDLVIFLVVSVLTSQLVGSARRGMGMALAREQEATRLFELSTGLAGANGIQEIAVLIAQKTVEVFHAQAVLVHVEASVAGEPLDIERGTILALGRASPAAALPLETQRGSYGEIHVWRTGEPLSQPEERMLHTFAVQGALAIERAALAQTEAQSKVLQESDRLKSALLSSVSHEFRTPLATIKAATTSLLNDQVDWDRQVRHELLVVVNEEADHLNHLVGNLLDMSKIEAGALKPNRQWNLLPEILDGVLERMQPDLVRYNLRVEIPEALPLVPVDYIMLEQVIMNLLGNCVKYAPERSDIQVSAALLEENLLLVRVTNQGPPVAPEHLAHIFDKFYRVTHAEKVSGTGLGLSICKGFIEAHGGKIWAENSPEGFAIAFTLPLLLNGEPPPRVETGPPL